MANTADYSDIGRYGVRTSHNPPSTGNYRADVQNDALQSSNIPKPNVIRIEVLSGRARQAFMGGFNRVLDGVKYSVIRQLSEGAGFAPFFGILANPAAMTFGVNATWSVDPQKGFLAAAAHVPVLGTALGMVKDATATAAAIGSAVSSLAGLDNDSVGSSTIKSFGGASVGKGFSCSCMWYMPEQENLFRLSYRRLMQLAYLRPLNTSGDVISKATSAALSQAFSGMVTEGKTLVTSVASAATNVSENSNDSNQSATDSAFSGPLSGTGSGAANMISDAVGRVSSVSAAINNFMGNELTIAPLPVRVTVGHLYDFEPMVITGVTLQPSTETFQNRVGYQIPIYMTVTITFDYWMTPGPSKQWVSVIGDEVFGPPVSAATVSKATSSGNNSATAAGSSTDMKTWDITGTSWNPSGISTLNPTGGSAVPFK